MQVRVKNEKSERFGSVGTATDAQRYTDSTWVRVQPVSTTIYSLENNRRVK